MFVLVKTNFQVVQMHLDLRFLLPPISLKPCLPRISFRQLKWSYLTPSLMRNLNLRLKNQDLCFLHYPRHLRRLHCLHHLYPLYLLAPTPHQLDLLLVLAQTKCLTLRHHRHQQTQLLQMTWTQSPLHPQLLTHHAGPVENENKLKSIPEDHQI